MVEMTNASECHRDAVFVCGGDRFVVFDRSAETGVRLAICDSLSLTTVVLLNESRSQRHSNGGIRMKRLFMITMLMAFLRHWSIGPNTNSNGPGDHCRTSVPCYSHRNQARQKC